MRLVFEKQADRCRPAQTKVRPVGEVYMQEGGLCARQRGPGAKRPVFRKVRPNRDAYFLKTKSQFPQVQAYRDSFYIN